MEIPVINSMPGEKLLNLIAYLRTPVENVINLQRLLVEEGVQLLTLNYLVDDEKITATLFLKVSQGNSIEKLRYKLSRLSYVEEFSLNSTLRDDLIFDFSEVKTIWGGRVRAAVFSVKAMRGIIEEGFSKFSTAFLSILWYIGRFTGFSLISDLSPLFESREWKNMINAALQYCCALGFGRFRLAEWNKIREAGVVKVVKPIDLEAARGVGGVERYRIPFTRGLVTGIFEKALDLEERVVVKAIRVRMTKEPSCLLGVKLIK